MGATFRRTLGFCLGTATCTILARDVPRAVDALSTNVQRVIVVVWCTATVINATLMMVLPVFYQSAGIQNEAALIASFALIAVIGALTRMASSTEARNLVA